MLETCKLLLQLFFLPFQEIFLESVFGCVFLIALVFFVVLIFVKIVRWI